MAAATLDARPALSDRYGDRYVLEFEISGPRGAGAHGLLRGQVGTVVELLDGAYEVEFSDDEGETYAELALEPEYLLVLHHRPQHAA